MPEIAAKVNGKEISKKINITDKDCSVFYIKPQVKLFLNSDKTKGLFGDGKYKLLRAVERLGSIQKAADELGRGYRKAWGDIRRAEDGLGHSLVKKVRGGAAGGSTELTAFGKKLLRGWEKYNFDMNKHMSKSYNKYIVDIISQKNK